MDLKAKRKNELTVQKEKRKEEVILAAIEVFKEKGIDNAKMTDIALKAEVGIASVYRYFKTKVEIVIEAAAMLWSQEIKELYGNYDNEGIRAQKGIDQVKKILEVFVELYENHQDFIKFIYEFDNYVVREKISLDKLNDYERGVMDLKAVVINALKAGKKDGTIEKNINENEFYNTITHTLMSLCEKLILRGHVLRSDEDIEGKAQIKLVIDMAVKYLKKN